jgi:hypothetical protein
MEKDSKQGETIRLTHEQMEAVLLADEAFARGEALTPAQVREMARKRTETWMKTQRDRSA